MNHSRYSCRMAWRIGLVLAAMAGPLSSVAAAEVNIYSYRKDHLIRPLLDRFTARTGIAVNLVSGTEDALLERLKGEGRNSPADLLLTADAGRLIEARAAGVLQPVRSAVLEAAIPAQYRDPDGYWFGLALRARVIFYAKDRVKPEALSSYESLADAKWKGKICIRSSQHVYNQSLLAAMIDRHGAAAAEAWTKGVVANLARKPQGGDRDQIKAVAAGECDIAVANTYYYANLLKSEDRADRAAAERVALFWPDQSGRGAHVNISGGGVTVSAKHRGDAVKLLEYLVGAEAQKIYAEEVSEYPVRAGVALGEAVAAFGPFKADSLNLAALAANQAAARRMFDRVGWR